MDTKLLALAFTLLQWKESRKVEIWEQYCISKSARLSPDESRSMEALSGKLGALQDEANNLGASLVLPGDSNTSHLQEGLPYPVALWVRGTLPPASTCLAVVGSRVSSGNGRKIAQRMAHELTESGIGIISGLALGIDTAAHLGAMETGPTWGIIGSGLRSLYPKENVPLMDRIVKSGGGVITCFPPDAKPLKWHFPKRNLIMAAWAHGVVIIEARAKSGSLITAKLALDLGKEVWAVPGAPEAPLSEGTNALLREGAARFTRGAKDVLEDLGSFF